MFSDSRERLGYERAASVFVEVAPKSPEDIIEHFREAVSTSMNDRAHNDNVTFLVMTVKEG